MKKSTRLLSLFLAFLLILGYTNIFSLATDTPADTSAFKDSAAEEQTTPELSETEPEAPPQEPSGSSESTDTAEDESTALEPENNSEVPAEPDNGSDDTEPPATPGSESEEGVPTPENSTPPQGDDSGNNGTDSTQDGSSENPDEIGEPEEVTSDSEDKDDEKDNETEEKTEPVLKQQTLTVVPEKETYTEKRDADGLFSWMTDSWKTLQDRPMEVEDNASRTVIKISGMLPEGASATVKVEEVAEEDIYKEIALFGYMITIRDQSGNEYVPNSDLQIEIQNGQIQSALQDGKNVLVYTDTGINSTPKKNDAQANGNSVTFRTRDIPLRMIITTQEPVRSIAASTDDPNTNIQITGAFSTSISAEMVTEDPGDFLFSSEEPLLAMDITMYHNEDEEYQPDETVTVSISNAVIQEALGKGEELSLWHIGDDGSRMLVQSHFSGSAVTFFADSFSSYVVTRKILVTTITASDGRTYYIQVTYDNDAEIPDNAELQVEEILNGTAEYANYKTLAASALRTDVEGVSFARFFDIAILANGREIEPQAPVQVQVFYGKETAEYSSISAVHFDEGGTDILNVDPINFSDQIRGVAFEADGFSVYGVIETAVLSKTVTTSDHLTYQIEVTYSNTAGIPLEGTELLVSEIKEGDASYDAYISASANKLGIKPENIDISRAFDIKIVDRNDHSIVYEPNEEVEVSITLIGADLDEYEEVDVIHFADSTSSAGYSVYDLNNTVTGDTVRFTTDGFSVYVIISEVPVRTYRFYSFDEYGDYMEYPFTDDSGATVFAQTIKNGETPVVPSNPVNPQDPTATFAGWYEATSPAGSADVELASEPYDFDNIPEITVDEEVRLYAKYASYAYIIFHDQYDSESGSFPVEYTVRKELNNGSAEVDISDKRVTYRGGTGMVFYGWSAVSVTTPGSPLDDEGHAVQKQNDTITVTGTTHLYPIFKPVYWLSFVSGPTGSGATYYPETYYYEGTGPATLADRIPTRDGNYTFKGWYTEDNCGGTRIANADGSLIANASAAGIAVNEAGNGITLTANVTLYAGWEASTTASYTIVIDKQKASDSVDSDPSNNTYEFAESFLLSGTIGQSVSAGSDYIDLKTDSAYNTLHPDANVSGQSNPYYGYSYNTENSDANVTVKADGSTILRVRYDWDTKPDMSGRTFTLTFADSVETAGETSNVLPAVYDQTGYGASLAAYVPSDPASGREGYTFTGWFADKACTVRAFFTQASYDAFTGTGKVLFETMPGADLTVYAGWELSWYVVTIDPNYGALYSYDGSTLAGTGSTWFWSAYGSRIQEYTTITRDYVPSDSGTWYYVNHAGDGQGGTNGWSDRYTYYTQNPSEATEFTTFAYEPGNYRYDGWYEVLTDGTEVPYDFNRIVDHNITLRLHWTKVGAYYLQYVPGDGVLNNGEEMEPLYVELDGDSYSDNADVVVARTATAPEGYEFIGWTIRGDDSGTVYRPGQTFTLRELYAATVQGKKTVYLEAVYTPVSTASIIYHANGGTIDVQSLDYGGPVVPGPSDPVTDCDVSNGTATISNLANNSRVYLSDGSGFDLAGAKFAGWCANPVYDPDDDSAPLFVPKTEYGVDVNEPADLYAVWQVSVNYHLNSRDASFGEPWDEGYVLNDAGDTYSQNVYLNTVADCPSNAPTYTGSEKRTFLYWATKDENDEYTQYDFSRPVTGGLDLYAFWGAPVTVPVHAVDASQAGPVEKTSDDGWTIQDLTPPASPAAPEQSAVTPPAGPSYELAFITVSDSPDNVKEKPVQTLYYSSEDGEVHVTYADGSDETLGAGEGLYYVLYQTKALPISYKNVNESTGKLSDVKVSGTGVPASTGALGSCNVESIITAPLTGAHRTGYYAYAIGNADAGDISDLELITTASGSDDVRPALDIENTWRGFQYSTDGGASWLHCGYEPALYVVYFDKQPTVVTFSEETFGLASDMETAFTFNYTIEQSSDSGSRWEPVSANTQVTLRDGEAHSAVLFTGAGVVQRITVTQTEQNGFYTTVGGTVTGEYIYTADNSGEAQNVTFTNTRIASEVEVHVAQVDVTGGNIMLQDGWRSATNSVTIALGETSDFANALPSAVLVDGQTEYALGAIFYGTDDGSSVTPVGEMTVSSVACEPVEAGSNEYALYLKDSEGNRLTELNGYNVYYLYYPKLTVYYMKEDLGSLTAIQGASSGTVTYGGSSLTLNGAAVSQGQKVEIPSEGLTISQTVGSGSFNMPPLLDEGENQYNLVYYKIGALAQSNPNTGISDISELGGFVSEGLTLYMNIVDNRLSWSFDGTAWTPISNWPVVYAIYRERGYDLTVTKTVPIDTGDYEPFTVTVSSPAISRTSYAVEGTGSNTIAAVPASGDKPGTISFSVSDGSSVKIIGLSAGTYIVSETANDNYTLSARIGSENQTVADNSTVTLNLSAETKLDLINTSRAICQIGHRQFFTITSAVEWIEANAADFSGTIEMLVDYVMPASDAPVIPEYLNVTLTSAGGTTKTITRKETFTSRAMFTNSGTFTLRGITLDGNHVSATGAMINNEGILTIGNGAILENGVNSGNGGAINSWGGSVTVSDAASISNNTAANGGAIYASEGAVTISGGSISDNSASKGGAVCYSGSESVTVNGGSIEGNHADNGGAIYMTTGTLRVSGGSMTRNTAIANGGAVYAANAVISVSGGTIGGEENGNSAANGGAIYADIGTVTVSGGTVSENTASASGGAVYVHTASFSMTGGSLNINTAAQNGGAVYAASGSVTMSGSSTVLSGNAAANGGAVYSDTGIVSAAQIKANSNSASSNGGAFLIGSGSATFSNCQMQTNSAVNGAAVFNNTGTVTFSAGTVTANNASNGGAVGIGSSTARLNLSGNIQIMDNKLGKGSDAPNSNIYLDQDTDAVINFTGLGGSASVGIYVPGDMTADLFMHRGVPSAFFGTYTSTNNLNTIKNDRLPDLSVQTETTSKRVFWGRAFTVEVHYLQSYAGGLPPTVQGTLKYTYNNNYYAPSSVNSASEIASSVQSRVGVSSAVFAHAFVDGSTSFDDYVTDVYWDSATGSWTFKKRDGTIVPGTKLTVYFSEPAYISIENNTLYNLTVNGLTVLGRSAINSTSATGYGYVFAENGVIENQLYPIQDEDLTLGSGQSVKLVFPGGTNAAYALTGSFTGVSGDISYTLTGGTGNPYTLAAASSSDFTLPVSGQPGKTLSSSGGTFEIVFGGNKPICKIVTGDVGTLNAGEIAGRTTEPDGEGNYEYTFSTLNQAKDFILAHMSSTKKATIEMLVDYLIPGSDVVELPAGYDITFTTAMTGTFRYTGTGTDGRATISRDQGNNASFISATGALVSGNYNTKLTVKNLIFDGKNFGGNRINGGIIKTKACNVEIDTVDFNNCVAQYGGGIFIESVWPRSGDQTPYGYLTVSNSNFTNCQSTVGTDKFGGGAIWTSMREMSLNGCTFTSCEATGGNNAQGGAVFHFVADINASIETASTVTGCTFDSCSGGAGGSIECGARTVRVTESIFRNSIAKAKNGGALNVWVYDSSSSSKDSWVYLDSCTFENCYCLTTTGSNGNGGAMRSTATHNTISNCTFINTIGNDGGAINIFNSNAVETNIAGCTFESSTASNRGGAIYCMSKTLKLDEGTSITSISNSHATNAGGAIYHGKDANGTNLTVQHTVIENSYSQKEAGGGIYSKAQTVSISDAEIKNCTTPKQGGGIYLVPESNYLASANVTVENSVIQNNISTGGMGGGIYTNVGNVTLSGTTVSGNTASGNGGGICHDSSSNTKWLTLNQSCAVTGNESGGMGGGIYTLSNLALQGATVTGNTLSHTTADSAAGIYMPNARTLQVGMTRPSDHTGDWYDTITVKNNTTSEGIASDLRLPEIGSGVQNSNSVEVLCALKGEICVVNAKVKGTQFGYTDIAYVGGFSDLEHVFIADDNSLYGTIDRADSTHKRIIWGTEPICKITDDRGRLLYLKIGESNFPAVFDYLDRGSNTASNEISAFGILRGHSSSTPKLFNADGSVYTGSTYQVKMLVENYREDSAINTPNDSGKTVILTTAGSTDSLYPYRGRTGTRSTVLRGSHSNAMVTVWSNLTMQNIVLDSGSEAGAPYSDSSRILLAETANTTIRLGKNAALQNAVLAATVYGGAGVRLNKNASLIIEGGTIRNCSAGAGGGAVQVKQGNLIITGGSITRCSAGSNGGGIFFEDGTFNMSGGSITRCSAASGAGVFVANGKAMTMTGMFTATR